MKTLNKKEITINNKLGRKNIKSFLLSKQYFPRCKEELAMKFSSVQPFLLLTLLDNPRLLIELLLNFFIASDQVQKNKKVDK